MKTRDPKRWGMTLSESEHEYSARVLAFVGLHPVLTFKKPLLVMTRLGNIDMIHMWDLITKLVLLDVCTRQEAEAVMADEYARGNIKTYDDRLERRRRSRLTTVDKWRGYFEHPILWDRSMLNCPERRDAARTHIDYRDTDEYRYRRFEERGMKQEAAVYLAHIEAELANTPHTQEATPCHEY